MSFLTPIGFIGALLAVPIVLLYMLRLRRREILVSSTFLWQQVLQDNEANTPWQRLRRNLLLFLQLLILALLVFALARPFITVPAVSTGQIALLLDASASMNATDVNGETSRLDAAKDRALEIIQTMSEQDTMTVIRVADVPEVLVPETRDRALLRDAVLSASPSTARADWNAALTLAAGTSAGEDFSVVIVSDGGLADAQGLPGVQGEIRYVPVGESSGNVAITALATRSLAGESPQLFSQITNYGPDEAEIIYDLQVDGELFTAERYTVPGNSTLPLVSAALPEGFERIEAGLTPATGSDTADFLVSDNTAFAVAENSGAIEALVMSDGNVFIDRVLGSLPGVRHLNGDIERGLPQRSFDLYIFDGYLPPVLPDADMFIINPPRSTEIFTVAAEPVEQPGVLSIATTDDRTAFLDLDSVNVRAFTPVEAPWAEPLITAGENVLMWAGETQNRQVAILTFPLGDSDLPLQISWPILVSNLLTWYQPDTAVLTDTALRTGSSLQIRPPVDADTVNITKPDGSGRVLDIDRTPLIFADTDQTGVYEVEVRRGNQVLQTSYFVVNLFDAVESNITPLAEVQLGTETLTETQREEVGQREFWPWLAALALLVLMIEWFVYHRRLRGPRVASSPPWARA